MFPYEVGLKHRTNGMIGQHDNREINEELVPQEPYRNAAITCVKLDVDRLNIE
jgi:hypothetical protein